MASSDRTPPRHDNLRPTVIVDHQHHRVLDAVQDLPPHNADEADYLRAAHRWIADRLTPVYSLDELQPTSHTLLKGKGSCSQRLALLEAFARAAGIPTRVRALRVSGSFWYPRFRLTRSCVPRTVLLAWPQFHIDGAWVGVEELFGDLEEKALAHPGFSNHGESLFEALDETAIDFDGVTADCAAGRCDLSGFVREVAGTFDTRDDLFGEMGSLQHTVRGQAFAVVYGNRKYR